MHKTSSSSLLNLSLGVCLILWTAAMSLAQISTATISGTVSDSQDARLADSKILITNTETGASTASATNKDGAYTASSLPIGSYKVEAQKEGFKTSVRGPIVLTVGENAVVHLVLAVGEVSETVEVAADVSTVDTSSSAV